MLQCFSTYEVEFDSLVKKKTDVTGHAVGYGLCWQISMYV